MIRRPAFFDGGQRIAISIGRRKFYAHRLAWKIHKGKDPKGIVDHWDLDQANNRIRNLRDISQRENTTHRKMNKNNTSGFRGVFFVKATNKWGARIVHQRKNIDLGSYDDPNEAHVTYLIASMMYHGRRYL